MKFKEFFKPNIEKIVILAISLIIWMFLPVIPVWEQIRVACITGPCPPISQISFISLIQIINTTITVWVVISMIIEFSILYLLSCLIIFNANKIKKKR